MNSYIKKWSFCGHCVIFHGSKLLTHLSTIILLESEFFSKFTFTSESWVAVMKCSPSLEMFKAVKLLCRPRTSCRISSALNTSQYDSWNKKQHYKILKMLLR